MMMETQYDIECDQETAPVLRYYFEVVQRVPMTREGSVELLAELRNWWSDDIINRAMVQLGRSLQGPIH
jgi:hypothetical protein